MKLSNTKTKLKNLSGKRKPEKLTDDDLKELMGVHRDTYKRGKGGAVRKRR